MMPFLIVYGGITILVAIVVLLDWMSRRRDREHSRAA
jgi:hypothetical protein